MPYIFYLSKVKITDVSIYAKVKTRKYHCVLSYRCILRTYQYQSVEIAKSINLISKENHP